MYCNAYNNPTESSNFKFGFENGPKFNEAGPVLKVCKDNSRKMTFLCISPTDRRNPSRNQLTLPKMSRPNEQYGELFGPRPVPVVLHVLIILDNGMRQTKHTRNTNGMVGRLIRKLIKRTVAHSGKGFGIFNFQLEN